MTNRWLSEQKRDHYYRRAKRERYRSRAAYKLKQINLRYKVIKGGDVVIDLGAAPGGWCQVAREIVGEGGRVVGVDLKEIRPIEGIDFFSGDVRDKDFIKKLVTNIGSRVDVVISDMSPKTSGNPSMDHARSIELCEHALEFARIVLKQHGNFVTKVFMGDLYPSFYQKTKKFFDFCKAHTPRATKKASRETYIIAKGFRH